MSREYGKLYGAKDKEIMKIAEDSLDPKLDRVDEILAFLKQSKYSKVGIANCISFEKEASELEKLLQENGFETTRANCKLGRVPFEDIIPGYQGVSCNPAGQAATLNENNTELNIVLGLCLGHDLVFQSNSDALSTTLLVKDRKYKHNPVDKFKLLANGHK